MHDEADSLDTTTCPMCGATIAWRVSQCVSCGENLAAAWATERERGNDLLPGNAVRLAAISTEGTVVPRYIAALLDNFLAGVLAYGAATSISQDLPLVQVPLFLGTYLGYYLLFEGGVSRTPGKMLSGLLVVQFDGRRVTWRQALVRTVSRLLEVNPACLGGLPAALCILWSANRQRFGDRLAGTIVVPSRRLKRKP